MILNQGFSDGGPREPVEGVHGNLLKGSTRPVEKVHDLLLAVLSSTEVQK